MIITPYSPRFSYGKITALGTPEEPLRSGWAGGAQFCLSNAFGEANKLVVQAQEMKTMAYRESVAYRVYRL